MITLNLQEFGTVKLKKTGKKYSGIVDGLAFAFSEDLGKSVNDYERLLLADLRDYRAKKS